jgi:hypothetical protein
MLWGRLGWGGLSKVYLIGVIQGIGDNLISTLVLEMEEKIRGEREIFLWEGKGFCE